MRLAFLVFLFSFSAHASHFIDLEKAFREHPLHGDSISACESTFSGHGYERVPGLQQFWEDQGEYQIFRAVWKWRAPSTGAVQTFTIHGRVKGNEIEEITSFKVTEALYPTLHADD